MNIGNLNQQELEQLQMLLNKINSTPTEKMYFDPVSKMIDEILDEFNFAKIQNTMDYLGWRWVGEYVTIDMLRDEAKQLLHGAAEYRLGHFKNEPWEKPITHCTGGLQASAFCDKDKTKITKLDLKFVLVEWNAEIEGSIW